MSLSSSATPLSEEDKLRKMELLRAALPACQPQEGSPANTFTKEELEELRAALTGLKTGPRDAPDAKPAAMPKKNDKMMDIFDPKAWEGESPQGGDSSPQDGQEEKADDDDGQVSWYGAPRIPQGLVSQTFRQKVRQGLFHGPTNAQCPGFLQCNLVILPEGPHSFDFLLFCQRNKKACPLIEVCDVGSPFPHGVARGADLRTDVPK